MLKHLSITNYAIIENLELKINNGFTVEELAYLILGWEDNINKIKKIKSYSKLMTIAKEQLLDKGLMFLDTAWENLDYIDNLNQRLYKPDS